MIIKKADYVTSCVKKEHYQDFCMPQFVFLGRSNVGKSSLINTLTSRKKLAYTSSKPGKTLTLNFYNINDAFYLVDVPGYGYAERSINHRLDFGKMIENYLSSSQYLKVCFLIVDIRHDPTADDILMYNYLKHFGKCVKVIATKCDKIPRSQLVKQKKNVISKLEMDNAEECIVFSSETKVGVETIHEIMEQYL